MTQLLPKDDDFAAGSPAWGGAGTGFLPLYLGFRSTAAISGAWRPDGRAMLARPLHGAYQSTNSLGIPDFNAALHDSGSGTAAHADARTPSGMVYRAPFAADVVVTGTFEMRALLGSPGIGDLALRGVIARAQAGTLFGDGTSDPEFRDGSCYLAGIYQKHADGTLRLGVFKFVAGALTLLQESAAVPLPAVQLMALATITLSVSGTAIFATSQGLGSSGTLRVPSSGTITDASVAGAGRCGIIMGADREVTAGKKVVDLCHLFAVDEGGVRKIQDEFKRLSLGAAKQTTADAMGTAGSGYLSCPCYWGAGSFDGSYVSGAKTYAGTPRLRRNATAGRVEFNHDVTDDDSNAGRLVLFQRHADSQFSQHRSIKLIVPSAPIAADGELWAGIILRGYQARAVDETPNTPTGAGPTFPGNGAVNTAGTGYILVLRAALSTSVVWSLRRLQNGTHFIIAEKIEASPFPGSNKFPGYGAQFTLDFEVFPRNSASPYGPVELVCKVDGVALDLALSAAAVTAGMFSPATGKFVDPTGLRVKSNFGEGLVAANGYASSGTAANNIDPIFEAWVQGALTNAEVADQDQDSVVLLPEGGATGTSLDLSPDEPLEVEHVAHEVSTPFASGHRQTMPRHLRADTDALMRRARYRFRRSGVKRTELDALLAHWNTHSGPQTPFTFTHTGEKVHYIKGTLDYDLSEAGVWDVAMEMETLA